MVDGITRNLSGTSDVNIVGGSVTLASGSTVMVGGTSDTNLTSIAGTAISVNSGNKSNGTQRIVIADDDLAVINLVKMGDWNESDRAKINPIIGQAGISAGSSVVGVTTPSVTLATDDPAVTTLGDIKTAVEIMDDWDATQDSAVGADGPQIMFEAKAFDGAALPNPVVEGNAIRPAATLSGVQYVIPVNKDGSEIASVKIEGAITTQGSQGALVTLVNARGSIGRDHNDGFDVSIYKWVTVQITSASSANLTVNTEGSIDTNENFSTNDHSFIKMKDLEDGSPIKGDTGVVFSGTDDTILCNLECGGLSFINFNVTSWTAGTVTVKIRGFNN